MNFGSNFGGGAFNFADAVRKDAYEPPLQAVLPQGNYVGRVTEAEGSTSSGNYPMVNLRLENEQGGIRDWIVISPTEFAVAKLMGLTDAAGLPRPVPGQTMDSETGRLTDQYIAGLLGKTVGFTVRDEDDKRNPGQKRQSVGGYCKPEKIKPGAVTSTPGGVAVQGQPAPTTSDIAF